MISKKPPVKRQAWRNKAPNFKKRPPAQTPEKARAYAFLLLKYRLRSEKELFGRLKQKGFTLELARDTVNFLKEKKFIDDRVFAMGWASSRLRSRIGPRRINLELSQKGLGKEIIQEALEQATQDYDEAAKAAELARKRFSLSKNIAPLKAKARVYGYLCRRGFNPEAIAQAMRGLGEEIE